MNTTAGTSDPTESTRPQQARRGSKRARVTRPRISGIDFARFVALIGMMAAHVWTTNPDGTPALIESAVSGKAAALFALLAGVGIALSTRSDLAAGRAGAARLSLLGRGLALVIIGLTLGFSPSGIIVILVYYGVMFWVAIPLLRWSSRALLIGAGVLAVVWPFVSSLLRAGIEQPFELGSASWLDLADPGPLLRGLFMTGTYPIGTWIVYAMVGMVVGRLIMAAVDNTALRRLGIRLAAVGLSIAAAAWGLSLALAGPFGALAALESDNPDLGSELVHTLYYGTAMGAMPSGNLWWLASPAPHSGTTLDLAITTGTALVVLGGFLTLGTVLGPRLSRVLEPIRRAGSAPLTVYTVHVAAATVTALILMANIEDMDFDSSPWYHSSGALWALHIAGAIVIGTILMLLRRRGPLETFVSWSGRVVSQRLRRRSTPTAVGATPVDGAASADTNGLGSPTRPGSD